MAPNPTPHPARAAHLNARPRALFPSQHAREKMRDRAVTWADVVAAVEHATVTEPHDGNRRYCRDDLCVVVADSGCVITVLLRRADTWSDADARTRTAS